jgi:phage shock protein A
MGDVGMAIQRAEDKTAQMQARAGAIDELLASGALEDPTGTAKDDITLELEQLASTSDVENELARMKAAVGAGPAAAPQAIEGQQTPSQQPPTQAAAPPSLDAQPPQQYQAPPSQGQEAPPAQPQGDLR